MNQFDPDPRCPSAEFGDESLPGGAQDLIGATLALMTGYAEHCPAPTRGGANPARRTAPRRSRICSPPRRPPTSPSWPNSRDCRQPCAVS